MAMESSATVLHPHRTPHAIPVLSPYEEEPYKPDARVGAKPIGWVRPG